MGLEKVVTVGTTATQILGINPSRTEYKVQNQGAASVYLGTSDNVATSGTRKGRELAAGVLESANVNDDPELIKEALYGIVATGSADVWVWEA